MVGELPSLVRAHCTSGRTGTDRRFSEPATSAKSAMNGLTLTRPCPERPDLLHLRPVRLPRLEEWR